MVRRLWLFFPLMKKVQISGIFVASSRGDHITTGTVGEDLFCMGQMLKLGDGQSV